MTAKTDRFWKLTATLGCERPPCEMPLGKEEQIRAFGMCGVKAIDLCGKPATECAWCSDAHRIDASQLAPRTSARLAGGIRRQSRGGV